MFTYKLTIDKLGKSFTFTNFLAAWKAASAGLKIDGVSVPESGTSIFYDKDNNKLGSLTRVEDGDEPGKTTFEKLVAMKSFRL